MTRHIKVTDADIDRAQRNDSYKCVVAQAIARTYKDVTNIAVDTQTIRFTDRNGKRLLYLTPLKAQVYVIAFDAGEQVEPFTFYLGAPIEAKRRVTTPAGKAVAKAKSAAREQGKKKAATATSSSPSVGAKTATSSSPSEPAELSPNEAGRKAYAEARAVNPGPLSTTSGEGRRPTPRVFKEKRRVYGMRVLRINQQPDKGPDHVYPAP